MRFGGHIAAVAVFVFCAASAYPQNPDSAKTPGKSDAGQAASQGTQSQDQKNNAGGAGQTQQANPPDQNPPANPADQNPAQNPPDQNSQANPGNQKKPTAEEEREQRIRLYDPLAKEDKAESGTGKPANGKNGAGQNGANANGTNVARPERGADESEEAGGGGGVALPGPTVASEDASEGAVQDYSGPAVLSRPYTILRPQIPAQLRWTPFIGINAVYDSGLVNITSTPNPNGLPSTGAEGAQIFWGIAGRRYIHRDIFGVSYRGDIQYYTPAKYYDISDHWLSLDYTHYFNRRISLSFVEGGAIYSQSYTLDNPAVLAEESAASLNVSTSPTTQTFNNGLRQLTSGADLTYQLSARLSFNAGGTWFGVHYNSPFLIGLTGENAHGDVSYRFTRRTTAGITYGFNQYSFRHNIGQTDFHTVGLVYSWAITNSIQVRAHGGVARLETSGLTALTLPAPLAILLGQGSVLVQYHSRQLTSDYSFQVVKDFRRGRSGSFSYARGVSPGNGIYLTSLHQTADGSGSIVLHRRYYASLSVGYDSLAAVGQNLGSYRDFYALAGVSRRLSPSVQANLRFDYRHFLVSNTAYLHNEYRVAVGISWSPVENFLHLW